MSIDIEEKALQPTHDHKGHRQRLKNKVRKAGLDVLEPHEVVELLLTYTIPYKDTNPLGHKLLSTFHNIENLINADYHDLININGVGKETALFFKVISQLFDIYLKSNTNKSLSINNTADAVRYFRKHYTIKKVETFLVLNLSQTNKVISAHLIEGQDDISVSMNSREFNKLLSVDAGSIILFHTHPNGDPTPSREDVEVTERIYKLCSLVDVELLDHIVLNSTNHYSFYQYGLLNDIKTKNNNTANNLYKIPTSKPNN